MRVRMTIDGEQTGITINWNTTCVGIPHPTLNGVELSTVDWADLRPEIMSCTLDEWRSFLSWMGLPLSMIKLEQSFIEEDRA